MNFKIITILLIMVITSSSPVTPIFFNSNKHELIASLISAPVCGALWYYTVKWADENYVKAENWATKRSNYSVSQSNNKSVWQEIYGYPKAFILHPNTRYKYYKYKAHLQFASSVVFGSLSIISFYLAFVNILDITFPRPPSAADRRMAEFEARRKRIEEEASRRLQEAARPYEEAMRRRAEEGDPLEQAYKEIEEDRKAKGLPPIALRWNVSELNEPLFLLQSRTPNI